MTDKQIIIDGVDVSGCDCFIVQMDFPNNLEGGYYNQNNLCECGIQGVESYPFFCKDNPNCFYKQHKRKEQECEKLKKKVESYVCSTNCYKYKKAEQYRMALEDIRDLINNPKNCVADIIYYSDKTAHDALQEG